MSCTNMTFRVVLLVFTTTAILTAAGQPGFEITRFTIDGGGVMKSAGGDFELSGSIGQPDAAVLQGGGFTLAGGFWFEEPPSDCNSTGNVNLYDYSDLEDCFSGPNGGLAAPSCSCFDLNGDLDVDLLDYGAFQRSFTGG